RPIYPFFFHRPRDHRALHSFPTRRSSDLSPRLFGKSTSLWALDLLAEVCHGKAWTPRQLTGEAIRVARKRLGIRWRRAKRWITRDRKSTRLNSSHDQISYAVFCLKKKKIA